MSPYMLRTVLPEPSRFAFIYKVNIDGLAPTKTKTHACAADDFSKQRDVLCPGVVLGVKTRLKQDNNLSIKEVKFR